MTKKEETEFILDIAQLSKELDEIDELSSRYYISIKEIDHPLDSIASQNEKNYLHTLLSKAHSVNKSAAFTLIKGIFKQRRAFFSFSQNSLAEIVLDDPDNKKKGAPKVQRLVPYLAKLGIHQIINGVKGKKGFAAGYVVTNPTILKLLNLSNEELYKQFNELKAFCKAEVSEEFIFRKVADSGGNFGLEFSVQIERIRLALKNSRSNANEVIPEKGKDKITSEELGKAKPNLARLADFFTDEYIQKNLKTMSTQSKDNSDICLTRINTDEFVEFMKKYEKRNLNDFRTELLAILKGKGLFLWQVNNIVTAFVILGIRNGLWTE
jgi:hypothetical protein